MDIFTSSYQEDLGEEALIFALYHCYLIIFLLPSLTTITSAIQKQNVRAAGKKSQFR